MADIELVIKIPEEEYINIKSAINSLIENGVERASMSKVCLAILGGIPLPKGHGDLIDRNDLLKHYDSTTYHNGIEERKIHFVQIGYVNDAQTIIEADKENLYG